jgi:PAS domain S-box-containing protein
MIEDAVIITSPDLAAPGPYIEYVNSAFERMTGYSADEVIGRCPRFLQGPQTDRGELDRMRRELTSTGRFAAEIVNYRKDGTPFFIEWRVKALRNETGRLAGWLSVQRDISSERHALEAQKLLAREVDHRAKNALTLVQGIVRLTRADDANSYAEAVQGRVDALATAHILLSEVSWRCVALKRLVDAAIARCEHEGGATAIGPDVELTGSLVQPVALLLHELVSNASKHVALSATTGRLRIEWRLVETELVFSWTQRGGPPAAAEQRRGFGLPMIEAIASRQLGGKVMLDWSTQGLTAELRVPLRRTINLT